MPSQEILRRAVIVLPLAVPLLAQGGEPPADAKASARPELPLVDKRPDQLFRELDRNGDGKLTADELPEDRRAFFDHLVRQGDKDKDSALTLSEFLEGLKPAARRPPPEGERPERGERRGMGDPSQLFERLDRNRDGKLTPDELDKLPENVRRRIMPAFDRLGKGELDREGFLRIAGRLRGDGGAAMPGERGPMEGRTPLFFRKLDKNNDGKLSKDELQNAAQVFVELDANQDGFLEVREMFGRPAFIGEGGPEERHAPPGPGANGAAAESDSKPSAAVAAEKAAVPPAIAASGRGKLDGKGPLRRFDANGDGKVSRDEAQGKLRKNFKRLDTNGDGFLERDELRSALKELKPMNGDSGPKA